MKGWRRGILRLEHPEPTAARLFVAVMPALALAAFFLIVAAVH